ncbi:CAP domain-containing protein [Streptomyces sp. NPDC050619]|uniref:CAP domain-containing protein n=1 Tax=Streptomyces sp. NPDC050619 TaxID=3157214 RepID=UPI00342940C7
MPRALYAVLAILTTAAAPAWAAGPPVPPPPPYYQAPLWPTPSAGSPTQPPQPHHSHGPDRRGTTEARLVSAVNEHRRQAGCRPLRPHAALNRAARAHSLHMARRQRLTHVGAGGTTLAERARAAGYRPRFTAENVTAGPADASAAVSVWMRSSPHRANLLTCRYTHAGVGVAAGRGGPWWTLDLASGH